MKSSLPSGQAGMTLSVKLREDYNVCEIPPDSYWDGSFGPKPVPIISGPKGQRNRACLADRHDSSVTQGIIITPL